VARKAAGQSCGHSADTTTGYKYAFIHGVGFCRGLASNWFGCGGWRRI
jgi:hypothetical protein